jgi:probable rRNA maturation factor
VRSARARDIKLEIVNRSGKTVPQAFLRNWVSLMAREAALAINPAKYVGRELVIAFVTSAEIKALNKTYRGKNKPTDVLSFESDDETSLGELAISPEVISVQAREHGLLVREELGYMVLHGFLHLLGYDHETSEKDAARMFKLQDELFERLLAKI